MTDGGSLNHCAFIPLMVSRGLSLSSFHQWPWASGFCVSLSLNKPVALLSTITCSRCEAIEVPPSSGTRQHSLQARMEFAARWLAAVLPNDCKSVVLESRSELCIA